MKRLLALLLLSIAFPLAAQPSRYSFATQVRPGFGTPLSAEATVNLLGDTYYALNATTFARLAGNITTTNKFKCQVGNGSISAAPGWCALVSGDIPANAANTTGTAAISTAATITNDATTAATMYPVWVTANTGNLPIKVSSTKLSFRPDTGILTATGFAGPLTGLASSATILATTRAINGVNFDGSAPITVAADASTLSGATLKSTVVNSSLTSVGALTHLEVKADGAGSWGHEQVLVHGATYTDSALQIGVDTSNADWHLHYSWAQAGNPYAYGVLSLNPLGGNVGIATTSFGTSAIGVLGIGNGTAPSTSPADMVQLWVEDVAASSELRVRDEAGNVTTLSPHNVSLYTPDPSQIFPWSFYARSGFLGKELNVDMYGAIAAIEKLTGKTFIYSRNLPADQIEDWTAQEAAKKVQVEKARLDKAMEKEIEVVIADAVEVVAVTEERPSATLMVSVTRFGLNAVSGILESVVETRPKTETFDTGKTESRLRAGVRLDEKTGKFWRHVRADEATVAPYAVKAPPAWMKDRMKVAVR